MNVPSSYNLLLLLLFVPLAACVSTKPTPPKDISKGDNSPRRTLNRFRRSIRNEKWKHVRGLLSRRARKCYSQSQLKTFLSRTKPGILERFRLLEWAVEDVSIGEEQTTAKLKLTHPSKPKFSRSYRFLLQNGIWRLDWSLADILDVPRSVESCEKQK